MRIVPLSFFLPTLRFFFCWLGKKSFFFLLLLVFALPVLFFFFSSPLLTGLCHHHKGILKGATRQKSSISACDEVLLYLYIYLLVYLFTFAVT